MFSPSFVNIFHVNKFYYFFTDIYEHIFVSFYSMILFFFTWKHFITRKRRPWQNLNKGIIWFKKSRYWNCHKRISDKLLE